MNNPVNQFASAEVGAALEILNAAINNHRQWIDSLHTSILCDLPFAKDILNKAAHQQCQFGLWYYAEVSESIKQMPEYTALESVHKEMHDNARQLAVTVQNSKKIKADDYQRFLLNQHHLIDLLSLLRDTLIDHEHSFDALTGTLNRKSLSVLLEQTFENSQRYKKVYSVVMLDIDYFKKVNDAYGHFAGDQVLKHLCNYLRTALRKSDYIGRYGGEEFLIILPETGLLNTLGFMENIREGIANQIIQADNSTINITVSMGVAELSQLDKDAWQAVKRADSALYQAKQAGRNCVKKIS